MQQANNQSTSNIDELSKATHGPRAMGLICQIVERGHDLGFPAVSLEDGELGLGWRMGNTSISVTLTDDGTEWFVYSDPEKFSGNESCGSELGTDFFEALSHAEGPFSPDVPIGSPS